MHVWLFHVVSPCLSLINLDNCELIELKETQKAEKLILNFKAKLLLTSCVFLHVHS